MKAVFLILSGIVIAPVVAWAQDEGTSVESERALSTSIVQAATTTWSCRGGSRGPLWTWCIPNRTRNRRSKSYVKSVPA